MLAYPVLLLNLFMNELLPLFNFEYFNLKKITQKSCIFNDEDYSRNVSSTLY